ncbi:MAG: N,N'-diacetylchitobiose phosphorylase [Clostridiales bacterium]|nr:N,N'-diacetylchitobiose phosphorylase [Clostridiales bacterium]
MRYGFFDDKRREYAVERVDTPVSWTNYIGTKDMCGVFNQTAGGYLFCGSSEYHRITRFRPNGVPMDVPGHYVYLRDEADGDFWSVSWQPVGKPLDQAKYACRHGLSYSRYLCDYRGIHAEQTLFVAEDDPVEFWDVTVTNNSNRARRLSVYSYCEFSFHQIDMDNRNFQMSLYAAGSRYADGVIEHDLYYEEDGWQFFTANFEPDGYDCLRDSFIGPYRSERNPLAVERGKCSASAELGGNHCGSLMKYIALEPGESTRLIFLLGEGGLEAGRAMRTKYASAEAADEQFEKLRRFWDEKLNRLQIETPSAGMNSLINTWTLYQSEINVIFSRFSSFIEVGGRTGLGYRDTAQDAMCVPHSNPDQCRRRLVELLRAETRAGYGLHLFEPRWFEPEQKRQSFRSPTVIPMPDRASIVHGIQDACSDDALWLVSAVAQYIKETGELSFADEIVTYADGGEERVYDHLRRILDFSAEQVGQNGICKGLRADWNDCLNLGGGESAMVSFLHYWALNQFIPLARTLGRDADAARYAAMAERVKDVCERVLWDGSWYIRGITADNRKIGTHTDEEGKVHLESNAWAVLSGAASKERGEQALASVKEYLFTPYGLMLNAPPYTRPDDGIGFVTRVYPGLKENGAIFSHPNPWAWGAACALGDGETAMAFYDALCPYNQNDKIEIRQAEPYTYCQFVVGRAHTAFGRARHPFMTGSAGWSYFAATEYILGVRPDYDRLIVDPCIPPEWKGFSVSRAWRGAVYDIHVENPSGVSRGVKSLLVDDAPAETIPPLPAGARCRVDIELG